MAHLFLNKSIFFSFPDIWRDSFPEDSWVLCVLLFAWQDIVFWRDGTDGEEKKLPLLSQSQVHWSCRLFIGCPCLVILSRGRIPNSVCPFLSRFRARGPGCKNIHKDFCRAKLRWSNSPWYWNVYAPFGVHRRIAHRCSYSIFLISKGWCVRYLLWT